ncbi:hypothetical protein DY000_02037803 [Brassica cretica]|uniref:Defensin-like protein n=1 Tax=Brassica cretica TaxID=69181 RepID=A0ABQ7BJ39_BRACR|nr:hypothetical protein DY000_02037803 [Brassica cretica]
MDSLRFTTVAVALLLLSFLHSPTEAEGGVCTEIQGSCLETSSCTRLCLESKGGKMVKSECRPPEHRLSSNASPCGLFLIASSAYILQWSFTGERETGNPLLRSFSS